MRNNLAHIPCQKCGKPVQVKIHPPRVLNFETISLIVIEHGGQSLCPCGTTVMPFVAQLGQIGLVAVEVPPEQREDIIIPSMSMKV